MKNYCGNREPFIFIFAPEKCDLTDRIQEALLSKSKVFFSDCFCAKDRRVIKKATAVVLILSKSSLQDAGSVVSYVSLSDKRIIPVYLDDLRLPTGMDMLLTMNQALRRNKYPSDEALIDALLSSPILSELSVTEVQKKAYIRTILAGIALAILVTGASIFLAVRGNTSAQVAPDSALGRMGLAGSYAEIKKVYIYGDQLREAPDPAGAMPLDTTDDNGMHTIYLAGNDEVIPRGVLDSVSDFAALTNVEELTVSGNSVADFSPVFTLDQLRRLELSCNLGTIDLTGISALENLTYLDLGYSRIGNGFEELLSLPNLKTLIISSEYLAMLGEIEEVPFEVICPQMKVSTWEECRAASENAHVYEIILTGETFTIPENETLTIRDKVLFSSAGAMTVENYGLIELSGAWEMGMVTKNNHGSIRVKDGGSYSSGMGDTCNYGTFIVEKGGKQELSRGEQFYQEDGEYVVEGELFIGNGGRFAYRGGTLVNTGRISSEYLREELEEQFAGKLAYLAETGSVEAYEAPGENDDPPELSVEEMDAFAELPNDPGDEASLDENGLTPRESAYYNNLNYYWPRMGGGAPTKAAVTPYTDPALFLSKRPEHTCAYLARDMEIEHCPAWADGYYELLIGPGATVTLQGDDWTADSAVTIMKGATLIIDGTFDLQMGSNFGTLISRGKFTYSTGLDQWGNEWGKIGNAGRMATEGNGSIDLYQIWSFASGSEEGNIHAEMRIDHSDREPPFLYANGYHSFGAYTLCYRAPNDEFDKKWWVEEINLTDYERYENNPKDRDALDEYGMTPRERAIYDYACSLDFLDFRNHSEVLNPVVRAEDLDLIGVSDGDIYIARDMVIDRASRFWYEKGGLWNIAVAPGVTVTIKGDQENWTREVNGFDPNEIWITVMRGGTLVIDGELPYALLVNHGDLIVNNRLFSTYYDESRGDLTGMIANDGTITVAKGGRLDALQVWSFQGAEENGEITLFAEQYEKRYDFTDRKCPFAFEHGVHGFSSFYRYILRPEEYEDGHDQFVQKFWDW